MRHNGHTVKHRTPKTIKPNKPKPQKVLPVMGKTQSNRVAKTHVAGRMAGTILTRKQKPFKGITQDVNRLRKANQPTLQTPKSHELQGGKGEKTYPVIAKGQLVGMGTIVKAKTWGKGRGGQNRCQIAVDGKIRGWAMLRNGQLIIIGNK